MPGSAWKTAAVGFGGGLGVGGLAVGVALWMGGSLHAESMARIGTTQPIPVLVASRDLHPGIALTAEDLVEVRMSPSTLQSERVTIDAATLVGRVPLERILVGEPVRAERLAHPPHRGLNVLVPRGRATLVTRALLVPGVVAGQPVQVVLSDPHRVLVADLVDIDGSVVTLDLDPDPAEQVARALSVGGAISIAHR